MGVPQWASLICWKRASTEARLHHMCSQEKPGRECDHLHNRTRALPVYCSCLQQMLEKSHRLLFVG